MAADTKWIRARMRDLGLTEEKLALLFAKDRSTVSRRLSDPLQKMRLPEVPILAEALQVPLIELLFRLGLWSDAPPALVTCPVVNAVQAGALADTDPDFPPSKGGHILVEYYRPTVFALKVEGDSMDKVAPEGSLVVVDYRDTDLRDGELVVAKRGAGATFKRYRRDRDGAWLEPDSRNPRHGAIMPDGGEPLEVVGRVIEIRPDYVEARDVKYSVG